MNGRYVYQKLLDAAREEDYIKRMDLVRSWFKEHMLELRASFSYDMKFAREIPNLDAYIWHEYRKLYTNMIEEIQRKKIGEAVSREGYATTIKEIRLFVLKTSEGMDGLPRA